MSDFLTRLAERAVGEGARVLPALPVRFSPGEPGVAPASASTPLADVDEGDDWTREELIDAAPAPVRPFRAESPRRAEASSAGSSADAPPPDVRASSAAEQPPTRTASSGDAIRPAPEPSPPGHPPVEPMEVSAEVERPSADSPNPVPRPANPPSRTVPRRAAVETPHPPVIEAAASDVSEAPAPHQPTRREVRAAGDARPVVRPSRQDEESGEEAGAAPSIIPRTQEKQGRDAMPSRSTPQPAAATRHEVEAPRPAEGRRENPPRERVRLAAQHQPAPRIVPPPRARLEPAPVPEPRERIGRVAGEQNPASAPAPAIHVSIGRVEVRAVAAPPTPARNRPAPAASASPGVSLDEYLRRRDGGRR
jgi:hypothetical protein